MSAGGLILLRVSNHKAYVWDVDDVVKIRSEYRVCAILTGTLPHVSQQNVFLGMPLVLLPEEVVLLVQNELAVIVNDLPAHLDPSVSALRQWNLERQAAVHQQLKDIGSESRQESTTSLSQVALQKRKDRQQKRAAIDKLGYNAHSEKGETVIPSTSTAPPHSIVIEASSSALAWYDPQQVAYFTLSQAREAEVWNYPSTLHERARCGVFRDLWDKGYFMGGGIKFGGDYLVYPGDPLRYHSHFAASVIDSMTAAIRPMEIVAHGRLGTATKKAHLLCGWDDNAKETTYFSVEWAGFG